jgi:SAM-dependent methyltransferase
MNKKRSSDRLKSYFAGGQIPLSPGYAEFKQQQIEKYIYNSQFLEDFTSTPLPENYGFRLDERIVEYPWVLSQLSDKEGIFLDAGSTFNYEFLLNHSKVKNKHTYIYTFYPEHQSFNQKRVSYVYDDLRRMPFRNDYFDEIACISTLEHIDMDNSIYGYAFDNNSLNSQKSYGYLNAVEEFLRILKPGGLLLISIPFGKYEKHGYFQQFDAEMLDRILQLIALNTSYELTFFRYLPQGWTYAQKSECLDLEAHNPLTGKGKGDDYAAHGRGICCIKATKNLHK